MQILKTKSFSRFMRKSALTNDDLLKAVQEIQGGLVDADLGAGLLKKRIARTHDGKSGGYRTILAYRTDERTIFMYGFAKNVRGNVSRSELKALQDLARALLSYDASQLAQAVTQGGLMEVKNDEQDV